jgi:hypothetical protein
MNMKLPAPFVALALVASSAFASEPQLSPIPLAGGRAIAHLKATGTDHSLAAAITTARYAVQPAAAGGGNAQSFAAKNPANGLRLGFTSGGLAFEVRATTATHCVEWRLLTLGYGDSQAPVPRGELAARGQRVELVRTAPAITEWFQNEPAGIEHGFTIPSRPDANPAGKPLRLVLAVAGDLTPHAEDAGQAIAFHDQTGRTVLTYAGLKVWDATGAALPAAMKVIGDQVCLDVVETGAVYPLTIDPTFATQQAYLKASNPGGNDRFGQAVAISGNTAVVGAPAEDSNATGIDGNQADNSAADSGAAYVFVRTGTTWT